MPGKVFCMVYALPGIPLCIVMFQSIGERMNAFLTFCLGKFKSCFRLGRSEISQTHVIAVSGNLCILVLTAGAAVFSFYEKWDYLDSIYYCFITLTTIGFGDFVALQRNNSLSKQPDYVAFSLIFILFGLAVVSSAMNLLVLRFLTMNTEDERRDELEAAAAAQGPLRLEGDVILNVGTSSGVTGPASTSAGQQQSISSPKQQATRIPGQMDWTMDSNSVCSCTDVTIACHPWQSRGEENTADDSVWSNGTFRGGNSNSSLANLGTLKPLRRRRKFWKHQFHVWRQKSSANSSQRGRYTRTRSPGPVVHLVQTANRRIYVGDTVGFDNPSLGPPYRDTWCKLALCNNTVTDASQRLVNKRASI